ncbi:MAG: plasmid pRiA4b ORF-3 family protein [Nitrosomonas sp.]|nr:plasmid pRiA4b ORF-3 family protein [Nitrosomonas sp.]
MTGRTQATALRAIYQLKVTLNYIRPPIWRRFLIASTDSLANLHLVVQIVMGWSDSHLHEFAKGGERYGLPDEDFPSAIHDESKFRISQILKQEKDKIRYTYDFGDSWDHEIVLEKILPFEMGTKLPTCLKGSRACPPEDVGGPPGYEMFLEALADPSHPEHGGILEWFGEPFDAEHFDLTEVNHLLHN